MVFWLLLIIKVLVFLILWPPMKILPLVLFSIDLCGLTLHVFNQWSIELSRSSYWSISIIYWGFELWGHVGLLKEIFMQDRIYIIIMYNKNNNLGVGPSENNGMWLSGWRYIYMNIHLFIYNLLTLNWSPPTDIDWRSFGSKLWPSKLHTSNIMITWQN